MTKQDKTNRRNFLYQSAGAATGGYLATKILGNGIPKLEEVADQTLEPGDQPTTAVGIAAGQEVNDEAYQHGGSPNRQWYTGKGLTPKETNGVETISVENQPAKSPIPAPDGNFLIPAIDALYLANPENGNIEQTLPSNGSTSRAIIQNGNAVYGSPGLGINQSRNIQNGNQQGKIDRLTGTDIINNNGNIYSVTAPSLLELDSENMNLLEEHNTDTGIGDKSIVGLEDGTLIFYDDQIRHYDPETKSILSENNDGGDIGFSTNGDYLFATGFGEIHAYDIDNDLTKVDSAQIGGTEDKTCPTYVEENNGDISLYSGDIYNGILKGFNFDGNQITEKFSKELEGPITATVGMGDAIVSSTTNSISAQNRHTGKDLWKINSEAKLGYPNNGYIPFFDRNSTIGFVDAEMGTLDDNREIEIALEGWTHRNSETSLENTTAYTGQKLPAGFEISNTGDIDLENADAIFTFNPENLEPETHRRPLELETGETVVLPIDYKPVLEGEFQTEYFPGNDTSIITQPVEPGESGNTTVVLSGTVGRDEETATTV